MESNVPSMSSEEISRIMKHAFAIADSASYEDELSDFSDAEYLDNDQAREAKSELADDRETRAKLTLPPDLGASAKVWSTAVDLTPEVVGSIEQDLSFYEKVSLVFLLYDSEELALQRIKAARSAQNRIGLIADWAVSEKPINPDWHLKLIEALSIIQNYSIIARLGFSRNEVDIRFLPQNPNTSLYVHRKRKILYFICESLDMDQASRVLESIKKDVTKQIPELTDFWAFNPELMEIALLQMMSLRFLKLSTNQDGNDVKCLVQGLKSAGASDMADQLELLIHGHREVIRLPEVEPSDQSSVVSCASENRVVRDLASVDDEFCYRIDPDNVGLCVIINQKNFYRDTDPSLQHFLPEDPLEDRIGTDVDRDRLCEAFISLGYDILVRENLTHIQIVELIRRCANEHIKKKHSSFVLCLLSHGKRNAIYGSNSIPVDIGQLENKLHGSLCSQLFGKPKIIIVQACQGTHKQRALSYETLATDGPAYSKTAPEVGDMITFWSTVPGFAAFRDKIKGSWFVKALWSEILCGNNPKNIVTVFTRVIGQVSAKNAVLDGEKKAMIPTYNSTFRRDLIFPYLPNQRSKAASMIYERIAFDKLLFEFVDFYMYKTKIRKSSK